jgi:DNA-binding response OmpR family regulator
VNGHVLSVEDELSIAELVRAYLERDGYAVTWARSGEEALVEIDRHPVRLVVLDIGLPGIDGFEVCRRLRASTAVPIVILSARDDEVDRVAGLEAGADDYVVKPFSPRELVARVKAVLRRADGGAALPAPGDRAGNGSTLGDGARGSGGRSRDADVLEAAGVKLDHTAREVTVDGARVDVTAREFDLLAALLANPGRVLDRDRLLDLAWGMDFAAGTRTVDVHIAQLRRKLGRPELIETVRGAGYKLVA